MFLDQSNRTFFRSLLLCYLCACRHVTHFLGFHFYHCFQGCACHGPSEPQLLPPALCQVSAWFFGYTRGARLNRCSRQEANWFMIHGDRWAILLYRNALRIISREIFRQISPSCPRTHFIAHQITTPFLKEVLSAHFLRVGAGDLVTCPLQPHRRSLGHKGPDRRWTESP